MLLLLDLWYISRFYACALKIKIHLSLIQVLTDHMVTSTDILYLPDSNSRTVTSSNW